MCSCRHTCVARFNHTQGLKQGKIHRQFRLARFAPDFPEFQPWLYWQTPFCFNKEFRDSEERASRRAPIEQAELPIMLPRSEQTFMDAIEQSSVELTAALERIEVPQEKAVTSKHQAIILDKLVQDERPEEEIPTGI